MDRGCRILLEFLGFKRIHDKELPFFMRSGTSKEPAIVFFHGLGIGLTSYVLFAAGLAFHYPDRTILLFEMPSITMKLDDNHVLPFEFSSHVAECLVSLGLFKNIVAGHSLGTACVAWMLRWFPQLVQGTVFVDPICFKLWHHHIAYNALYREPKGFHETFINLVAMSEADHALYLHRYFVWFQNSILTKDLPENSFIFLSEKDNIVATEQVVDYLLQNPSSKRKLILYKSFRHGQILASPEMTSVVQAIGSL
jgi:pimeloyl-ACP methyl ester carboxylesterase